MLDVRNAQTSLEVLLKDAVLKAFGKRKSFASVADLRLFETQGASGSMMSNDDLACIVVSNIVTVAYKWSETSVAADDGAAVVKPQDVNGPGRWLSWTSPLRVAPVVGGNSYALHELSSGPLQKIVVFDKDLEQDELTTLLQGEVPAVAIDAQGDDPTDQTQNTGHKWDVRYKFTLYIVSQSLRDNREAAQGSVLDGDIGANALDGLIWSLLGGTVLFATESSIKNVIVGSARNWQSDLAQRVVVRSREYTVLATVENPAAPNDAGPVEEFDAQFQSASTDESGAADPSNFVQSGINVPFSSFGVGLSKNLAAGVAFIGGAQVNYAGELHTFSASVDTYRDLLPNGTLVFQEVANNSEEPSLTPGALRVGVTITDSAGVAEDRYLAAVKTDFGPVIQIPTT
jgi:hypothetical protein